MVQRKQLKCGGGGDGCGRKNHRNVVVVLLRKLLNCGSAGETLKIWWWFRESNRNVVVMVEKNS